MNRTKLVEGGKRIRKNWSTNYIVLTDLYLLFFKDAKTANSVIQTFSFNYLLIIMSFQGGKPDFFIELAGAMLTWSPEKSSKKNCFQISTVTGFQVLLQEDCPITCKEWHDLIKNAINKLVN